MVYFKENYNFPRFQRGSNFFPGGGGEVQLFLGGRGGSNCLFPIESHITCVFPREGPGPLPPLWISACNILLWKKLTMRKSYQFWPPPPLPWVFLNVYMVSGKKTIVAWPGSKLFLNFLMGAQWLTGRVLDSRPKGQGYESHWCHCVVVLEQDTFILA